MTYPGGQYQGLGLFEGKPPPRRTGRVAAIAVGAIVVVVGAVVALLPVTGGDDSGGPGPEVTTTTAGKGKTTTSTAPRGETVSNEEAHVAYSVPDGWTVTGADPITLPSMPGLSITARTGLDSYDCEGTGYSRGFAGSGTAPPGEINKVASDIAHALGTDAYAGGSGVAVAVGTPRPVTRTGDDGEEAEGVLVEAVVTTSGSACLSTEGLVVVTVLAVADGQRFVVVNGDTEGGPADPPPPDRAALLVIAESVRPTS